MRRYPDSATLIEADRLAAQADLVVAAGAGPRASVQFVDAKSKKAKPVQLTDPGKDAGASIKCPDIYEALKRKGYSKEKAARISNSRC